ncbi:hypothetical protein H6F88_30645 [Oculatella sp. FACHB-28]|uniref:hypothetical protein n=1 Tax=Oculatella sp. FACHB-28 TaxID=2692845 RepID=UPI00168613FC|nr:hypothetical protein [Oculatella sp. FACHB-28]MBD2060305.1 hypothetical protein [Oculatella sp. FACHB-28]
MMTEESSVSSNETLKHQLRFLSLCAEQMRRSGSCAYPPLIELIERYETSGGCHWKTRPHIVLGYHHWKISASYNNASAALGSLQTLGVQHHPPQIQLLLHGVAIEIRALEMEAQGVQTLLKALSPPVPQISDEELTQPLKTLSFTGRYLLGKTATQKLLSHPQTAQRCSQYISELQESVHELSQTLLTRITEAAIALGIVP